jgi:hypothetical protein
MTITTYSIQISNLGGSLFTNNPQVYYKSHSLSTGGGSGVRNYRKNNTEHKHIIQ